MARLIFISPYMKGGRDAARLAHRTRYFATREGVHPVQGDNAQVPATKKQAQYIRRLLHSFPEAKELPEYGDYMERPSVKTAAAFMEQVQEQLITPMDGRENYLDYVAHRPGVKTLGEHGLWDAKGKVPSLENAIAEVAQHAGNVWTPVISLSRENAERMGYTDLESWQALIHAALPDLARGYKIHPDHLRWYAALHEKERHLHVHMVLFSTDPKEGYLTRQGIRQIRSALTGIIYREERMHLYQAKDRQRTLLHQAAGERMAELIRQMECGRVDDPRLEQLLSYLSQHLQARHGRKVYGYLPPKTKAIVDEIVEALSQDAGVSAAYALWQDLREELCRDYGKAVPERVPLSRQREFKTVRNMVVREVLRMAEPPPAPSSNGEIIPPERTGATPRPAPGTAAGGGAVSPGMAAGRMLHHMGRIFRENTAALYTGAQIDRKRRKELQEKRQALGQRGEDGPTVGGA